MPKASRHKDAANAQHDAEIAAMQKQAALDQQRANEQAQVSQHQAQAAMDHRAQVFKDANRLGLGSAAANTGALFQAAAIAGQGALGHDSPLYVEAEKKAEDALRDLERQVEQAQKQVDDAKKTKADRGGRRAGWLHRAAESITRPRVIVSSANSPPRRSTSNRSGMPSPRRVEELRLVSSPHSRRSTSARPSTSMARRWPPT
jgi:hypothetical protein